MRIINVLVLLALFSTPVFARTVADVNVPEMITVGNGVHLQLNGAGIRYKFFFKIYIAELYVEHPTTDAHKVIADEGRKRVVMHFLYHKVTKEDLNDAWNEDFKANLNQLQFAALKERIKQFNSMFETVKSGDDILLDYIPGTGTEVTIQGQAKGIVPGKDFNDALLSVWLGKKPISEDLRKELLGASE
jgi:hypothetical protein